MEGSLNMYQFVQEARVGDLIVGQCQCGCGQIHGLDILLSLPHAGFDFGNNRLIKYRVFNMNDIRNASVEPHQISKLSNSVWLRKYGARVGL